MVEEVTGNPEGLAWLEQQWEREDARLQRRREIEAMRRVGYRLQVAVVQMTNALNDAFKPVAQAFEKFNRAANPKPLPPMNRAQRRARKSGRRW